MSASIKHLLTVLFWSPGYRNKKFRSLSKSDPNQGERTQSSFLLTVENWHIFFNTLGWLIIKCQLYFQLLKLISWVPMTLWFTLQLCITKIRLVCWIWKWLFRVFGRGEKWENTFYGWWKEWSFPAKGTWWHLWLSLRKHFMKFEYLPGLIKAYAVPDEGRTRPWKESNIGIWVWGLLHYQAIGPGMTLMKSK